MVARLHDPPKPGETYGNRHIVALIDLGKLEARALWRCTVCGTEGVSLLHNLRNHRAATYCQHRRKRAVWCRCAHHKNDHRPNDGECLDDDCDCTHFDP